MYDKHFLRVLKPNAHKTAKTIVSFFKFLRVQTKIWIMKLVKSFDPIVHCTKNNLYSLNSGWKLIVCVS
jgi:hypothetical protein